MTLPSAQQYGIPGTGMLLGECKWVWGHFFVTPQHSSPSKKDRYTLFNRDPASMAAKCWFSVILRLQVYLELTEPSRHEQVLLQSQIT